MINNFDDDTAIIIGLAKHAMAYHARNGGDESRKLAVVRLKEAADRLGFDLVPRKTPADLHAEAIAARTAEDAHDDDPLSQMGICDCDYCRAREAAMSGEDDADIDGGR